jgi:hypothetical protein
MTPAQKTALINAEKVTVAARGITEQVVTTVDGVATLTCQLSGFIYKFDVFAKRSDLTSDCAMSVFMNGINMGGGCNFWHDAEFDSLLPVTGYEISEPELDPVITVRFETESPAITCAVFRR